MRGGANGRRALDVLTTLILAAASNRYMMTGLLEATKELLLLVILAKLKTPRQKSIALRLLEES